MAAYGIGLRIKSGERMAARRGCSMTSLSTRRPLFLSGQQRRRIQARRFLLSLLILAPFAFASGYFFGG